MKENSLTRTCYTSEKDKNSEALLTREWLVTNSLGGYASGTISGAVTRRYHGLLIAALPNPFGRTVMLNHIDEKIILRNGESVNIGGEEKSITDLALHGIEYLKEFKVEMGIPTWRYEFGSYILEKKIIMPHRQNSVVVYYKLLQGEEDVTITLRPSIDFRRHEAPVNSSVTNFYRLLINDRRFEVAGPEDIPRLKLLMYRDDVSLEINSNMSRDIYYRLEADRGYEFKGTLWSLGCFTVSLEPGSEIAFTASSEKWTNVLEYNPQQLMDEEIQRRKSLLDKAGSIVNNKFAAELVLAADQFIITPVGRAREEIIHVLSGEETRTVIAGYHWFTDWGRDTMISLEGLTLTTGRLNQAKWILRTFAHYVREGLIPNLFPEGEEEGLYHTADASLWFFHAVQRYLQLTDDSETLEIIFPKLKEIIDYHIKGTRFGIHVDHSDGLLIQGEEHYQLTWMDAKVEGWVVTPRRGKAVEINALWYNALCLFENWQGQITGSENSDYSKWLSMCKESFNEKFWYKEGGYLYDVVEGEAGNDIACRPNQVFAVSLPNPVLNNDKWRSVLNVVKDKLLTPVGLRSLAPGHPDYKEKYFGDLRARDAAYHQGTVWAWLIGPFIDAWVKVFPEDKENPKKFLRGFEDHLCEACAGSISEVFDAEAPYTARGCIAQAWSVAEVLRCIKKIYY